MRNGWILVVVVGKKRALDEAGSHETVDFVPVQGNGECLRVVAGFPAAARHHDFASRRDQFRDGAQGSGAVQAGEDLDGVAFVHEVEAAQPVGGMIEKVGDEVVHGTVGVTPAAHVDGRGRDVKSHNRVAALPQSFGVVAQTAADHDRAAA